MLALRDWQNFYMLTGTAAATLIGLLFVAASISVGTNLTLRQATNSLRTYVDPTLLYYVQALIVSCLAVMPLSTLLIPAVVLMVLGILDIFLSVKVGWRILALHREEGFGLGHALWHITLPLLAGILYTGSAIGLLVGLSLAPEGLSIAVLLCLAIGLHNTWMLTIWLILHRDGMNDTRDEQAREANRDSVLQ